MDPREIYILFGKRVAEARDQAKLTQQGLADKVGLSRASVANIEAGRQRIVLHQALEITHALDLRSVTDLLPADLVRHSTDTKMAESVILSGSRLSKSEEDAIRSIVANS